MIECGKVVQSTCNSVALGALMHILEVKTSMNYVKIGTIHFMP